MRQPSQVLSDLGLGMLLFLAGLEIDVHGLRGRWAGLLLVRAVPPCSTST